MSVTVIDEIVETLPVVKDGEWFIWFENDGIDPLFGTWFLTLVVNNVTVGTLDAEMESAYGDENDDFSETNFVELANQLIETMKTK